MQRKDIYQTRLAAIKKGQGASVRLRRHYSTKLFGKVHSPRTTVQGPKSEVQSPQSKVQGPRSKVHSPRFELGRCCPGLFRLYGGAPGSWAHVAKSFGFQGFSLAFSGGTAPCSPSGVPQDKRGLRCHLIFHDGEGPRSPGAPALSGRFLGVRGREGRSNRLLPGGPGFPAGYAGRGGPGEKNLTKLQKNISKTNKPVI